MNYLEQPPQDDRLSRGIGISFAIHALLLSFFTLKAVFFTSEPIDFSQAVRVDIVGLPEKVDPKTLTPPSPTPSPEEAQPTLPEKKSDPQIKTPPSKPVAAKTLPKKTEEGLNLQKVKSQQKSAIEKLKAMAALEKIKQEMTDTKKVTGTGKSNTSTQKIKGNILSPGTSLTGLAKLQQETYVSDLDRHIKQNWSLPEWLAKRDYTARVRLYIDSHGNILERKIVKSSGNSSYDEEVLATIDRSSPFPSPPEKFLAIFSVDGILIGFPE